MWMIQVSVNSDKSVRVSSWVERVALPAASCRWTGRLITISSFPVPLTPLPPHAGEIESVELLQLGKARRTLGHKKSPWGEAQNNRRTPDNYHWRVRVINLGDQFSEQVPGPLLDS